MSQTVIECTHCDMCHKEGLPILLTRYAVATKSVKHEDANITYESKAPDLAGKTGFDPFQNSGGPIPLGEHAYYTLRRLRPGFVYTYNPNALEGIEPWRCYQVTESNCLLPVPLLLAPPNAPPADAGKPQKVSPCKPEKNESFAACITISPEELYVIETLWIAFSDVRWTQQVLNQYEADTDGCRSKTMRPFNVKEWIKSGAPQKHFEKIDQVDQYVAEYAPEIDTRAFEYQEELLDKIQVAQYAILDFTAVVAQYKLESVLDAQTPTKQTVPAAGAVKMAFHWLVQVFARARAKHLPNETEAPKIWELARSCLISSGKKLATELRRLHEKAAIVALDDIPGIAMELAILTNTLHTNFTRHTEFARPLVTHNAIEQARTAIFDQAELKWLKIKQDLLEKYTNDPRSGKPAFYPLMSINLKSPNEIPKEKPSGITDAGWKKFNELHKYLDTDEQIKAHTDSGVWTPEQIQRCTEIRAKRPQDLEVARNTAWNPYINQINTQKRSDFKTKYEAALAPYHSAALEKPIRAHVQWMASPGLIETFKNMYDKAEILSGFVLANIFTKCLDGTQKFEPCAEQYQHWLEADETAITDNPLWIAFTFNNAKIQEALSNSVKALKAIKIERDALEPKLGPWKTAMSGTISNQNAEAQVKKSIKDWEDKQNGIEPAKKVDYVKLVKSPVGYPLGEGYGALKEELDLKQGSPESATVTAVEEIFKRHFAIHEKFIDTISTAVASAVAGEHNTLKGPKEPTKGLSNIAKAWYDGDLDTKDTFQNKTDERLVNSLQTVNDTVENMVNRLFGLVSGPAVNVVNEHTQKGTYSPLLVHSGAISRAPYIIVRCSGSIHSMAGNLMRTMLAEGEQTLTKTERRRITAAVQLRLTALQANGLNTNASVAQNMTVAIPWKTIRQIGEKVASSNDFSNPATRHALQRLIIGIEEIPLESLEQMREGQYTEAIKTARAAGSPLNELKRVERVAKGRTLVGGALKNGTIPAIVAIFSIAGMKSGYELMGKAERYGHGALEAYTRFGAAVFSFAEVLLKAAEKTIKTIPTLMLRLSAWGEGIKKGGGEWTQEKIKGAFFSRWVGRFAGGLATIANVVKAGEKYSEGETLLFILYSVSAVLAGLMIFIGGWIGLILFAFSIAIMFFIEIVEGNPFENWMRKCWFGKHTHKYNSIVEEAEKFAESFKEVEVKVE